MKLEEHWTAMKYKGEYIVVGIISWIQKIGMNKKDYKINLSNYWAATI